MLKVSPYLCILVFVSIISGCNTISNGSYSAILIYNNEEFNSRGYVEENKYTIGKEIGIVSKKVKPKEMPTHNLWSNYLEKGTVLYRSNEDKSVILVKHDDQIEIFKKATGD
ncbi:hypothetical protein [Pseudalkalibacillus berkeleyi]|uniref:Lipoprotein n=1 Tax=Pseudalkalibacillus berkeleyi TaxID=1069813 RepID=A0ABS9GYD9_9BACL|nr:hypothetical protein [Pseudalkalibacillus berkeleyi]MCF6137777.1 hypothetical protein [Pseudalkalibacillus berkeleyi]